MHIIHKLINKNIMDNNNSVPDMDIHQLFCPICTDIPSVPIKLKIFTCECYKFHRYCLTCVRDSLNLNGYENGAGKYSLSFCPICRADFSFGNVYRNDNDRKNNRIKWNNVYEVDNDTLESLDEEFGETECPRECEWKGLRCEIRNHLGKCNNSIRFKCKRCKKKFDKNGLQNHLDHKSNYKCRNFYRKNICEACDELFFVNEDFNAHKTTCPLKRVCGICNLRFTHKTANNDTSNEFTDHYFVCSSNKINELTEKVNQLLNNSN